MLGLLQTLVQVQQARKALQLADDDVEYAVQLVLGGRVPEQVYDPVSITVLSPKAGDVWYAGSDVEVRWADCCPGADAPSQTLILHTSQQNMQ